MVLISGNIPFKTEVASVFIFGQIESDRHRPARRRLAVLLLVISLVVLLGGLHRVRRCRPGGTSSAGYVVLRGRWRSATLALLLRLPASGYVFYQTFEHGFAAAWDAVTTPPARARASSSP